VDVVGSDSILNEFELIKIIDDVFSRLGIKVIVKINNRKLIAGLTEIAGQGNLLNDFTTAIDQIEKIGIDASIGVLQSKGATSDTINKLLGYLNLKGGNLGKLKELRKYLKQSEKGRKGVDELSTLFRLLKSGKIKSKIELDLNLARGLNYYTGAIIEVKSKDESFGSICGGGRYDNLTGIFGLPGISGVGVSFGADRIYDVMLSLGLFDEEMTHSVAVMIVNFGGEETAFAVEMIKTLHKLGISCEFYPESVKLKKQLAYADSRKIPYVILAGENEIKAGRVAIKVMSKGTQKKIEIDKLGDFFLHR
jgi:histidyl-tRNA synthetase